jgi:uncharacterized protein (DUF2147 family)
MKSSRPAPGAPAALIAAAMTWFLAAAHPAAAAGANAVTGRWLTQNGHAVIEIAPCGGSICGRIDWLYQPIRHGAPARDDSDPDRSRRRQPLCGLVMLWHFAPDPSDPRHWQDGYIYDPESGDTYHAEITVVDPDHLHLRGYVGIPLFGETQTWTRVAPGHPVCHAG